MSMTQGGIAEIKNKAQTFTDLRQTFHRHPELGFEETFTSALVAEKLSEWGYEVTTGIAGTGVVGPVAPRDV